MRILLCLMLMCSFCACAVEETSVSERAVQTVEALPSDTVSESSETSAPEILTLTIPEGYTLARIGMRLEELGVCSAQMFIDAAQSGDFSQFPLVAAQLPDERRCFRLEGYLFPDSYQIYATDSPEVILQRILTHTEQKIDAVLREQIAASGYTIDEILTLASIIEKEAFGHEQMPMISSVLHNRLNQGIPLQCDVTINYVEGAIKPFISGDPNRYNTYYNTYKCEALPAGAICNPSLAAIQAALSPAQSDYLFFVTDADKQYYYASTWEGHLENISAAGLDTATE